MVFEAAVSPAPHTPSSLHPPPPLLTPISSLTPPLLPPTHRPLRLCPPPRAVTSPPSPFPPVFPSIPQRHMGAGSNEAAARANQAEGGIKEGAMQRRVLAGLTEVGQAVCSGRAKCVVLAPNVEEVPGAGNMWRGEEGEEDGRVLIWRIQGGLAAALASIISTNTILVVVALSRCRLAKVSAGVERGEVWCYHAAHRSILVVLALSRRLPRQALSPLATPGQVGTAALCGGLTPTTISLPPPSHSHHLTPTTISLPPSHSHHHLTPTTISLPPPSHSHHHLTPTTISLPPSHSHHHLIPTHHLTPTTTISAMHAKTSAGAARKAAAYACSGMESADGERSNGQPRGGGSGGGVLREGAERGGVSEKGDAEKGDGEEEGRVVHGVRVGEAREGSERGEGSVSSEGGEARREAERGEAREVSGESGMEGRGKDERAS
ncbi:unnamed protein product [Closterium sp. NIES-64]|nr:unnamed protein product [Closterium sp. NIES-64]